MLVFDERARSDAPGLHALIIGVSQYDHLLGGVAPKAETYGLGQLSSPARTAAELARMLIKRSSKLLPPLHTCRLLLSPTAQEADEIGPSLSYSSARLADVGKALVDWRGDALNRKEDATLFFFSGHGIQQSLGDSVLLLQDLLAGPQPLDHALDLLNVYNGMCNANHQPDMALTQFYIIDACRNSLSKLRDFENLAAAQPFMVQRGGSDERTAPIFFSSAAGHNAFNLDPNSPTLFGGQLLCCLAGAAGDKRLVNGSKQWVVTVADLAEGLSQLANKFNRDKGPRIQTFNVDHQTDLNVPIHLLDGPPTVELGLSVDPEAANAVTEITVVPPYEAPLKFGPRLDPHPYCSRMTAGGYAVRVAVQADGVAAYRPPPDDYITVKGPNFEYVVTMGKP